MSSFLNEMVGALQLTTDYIKISGKTIIVSPIFTKFLVLKIKCKKKSNNEIANLNNHS